MDFLIILLCLLPTFYAVADLFHFASTSRRLFTGRFSQIFTSAIVIGYPLFFLFLFDFDYVNDCCNPSAFFSPAHRLSLYVLIALGMAAYIYSVFRTRLKSPLIEVLANSSLIIAFVLNFFIALHATEVWMFGCIALGLFLLLALMNNHAIMINEWSIKEEPSQPIAKFCWRILKLEPWVKYPILLMLSLPLLFIIITVLMLFGQQADSIIRGFTDTYKNGLSQWDYQCENVECGDHYLCSVAANGHKKIVKPQRLGVRRGSYIIANRQLLIANAFEDLLEEHLPKLHLLIRLHYNKVGNKIHKHYHLFSYKPLSDIIYFLMKPLEWSFLFLLYLFDSKPENRIALQYLPQEIKSRIIDAM